MFGSQTLFGPTSVRWWSGVFDDAVWSGGPNLLLFWCCLPVERPSGRAWIGAGGWAGWTWPKTWGLCHCAVRFRWPCLRSLADLLLRGRIRQIWISGTVSSISFCGSLFFLSKGLNLMKATRNTGKNGSDEMEGPTNFMGIARIGSLLPGGCAENSYTETGAIWVIFSAASLSFKLDLKVNSENENQMRGWNMNTSGIINLMKPLILDLFRRVFPINVTFSSRWALLVNDADVQSPLQMRRYRGSTFRNSFGRCQEKFNRCCCTCAVNMTNWIFACGCWKLAA